MQVMPITPEKHGVPSERFGWKVMDIAKKLESEEREGT